MEIGDLRGDLKSARLMYLKGFLFLLAGCAASAGIVVECGSARVALLLAIAIWSFCRLYYFLFYVIEKYIDPSFKFAGIIPALQYIFGRQKQIEPQRRKE